MQKKICFLILFLPSFFLHAQTNSVISGQIILQLHKNSSPQSVVSEINTQYHVNIQLKQTLSKRLNISLLQYDGDLLQGEKILSALYRNPNVANAQFNHSIESREVPNDPDFDLQWNMLNNGESGALDADIDADDAWDITQGGLTADNDTIVIAIVDDGFDLAHEDLDFWKNRHEIPGNLVDDDGNGYVDDYDGWNAADASGNIIISSHGTHVAGIAGAIGNNGIGVSGVNWHVKLMPVVAFSVESEVIMAYSYILESRELYTTSHGAAGAFIVATNTSFGIDLGKPEEYPIWCALYDSLGNAGILSAAATANLYINVDVMGDIPTACPSDYLIAVTYTNRYDNLSGSAYGAINIDLGAPGYLIYSTVPDSSYGYKTGTSMASPHVAGAVALMMAAACKNFILDYKNDPANKILLLKDYMLQSVDYVPDLNGISVSNGRLNLNNSLLTLINSYCDVAVVDYDNIFNFSIYPNPAHNKLFIENTAEPAGQVTIEIYNILGEKILEQTAIINKNIPNEIVLPDFAPGIYLLTMKNNANNILYTSKLIIQ